MIYTAVGKKTGTKYIVTGKDSIGTLIELKEVDTGITVVGNRCYYNIYREDGSLVEE